MPRPYVTLAEYPMDMVRARLHEVRPPWAVPQGDAARALRPRRQHVALRLELAAGCPKIAANKIMDLCGVYYPDRVPIMSTTGQTPIGPV